MSRQEDLNNWAQSFAGRLTTLLNGTVTADVAATVFLFQDAERAIVAPGADAGALADVEMVPLSITSAAGDQKTAPLWLSVWFLVGLDDEGEHLSVQRSSFGLCVKQSSKLQPIRIEYDRRLAGNKQAAHVQVTGDSGALGAAYTLANQELKALHKLHIPLGDRRFRPSIEDFIEFLVQERLINDLHKDWRQVLEESRGDWHSRQVRAAVRRSPEPAVEQLQTMGYSVAPPPDTARDEAGTMSC